jgi:peptide/nickel transport system permease protein
MTLLRLGLALAATLVALTLVGPALWPHDPLKPNYQLRYASPSAAHPLGTDGHGRDVVARVLAGGRISLAIATLATALALTLGTLLGLAAASLGAGIDLVLTRLMDALLAFPGFLLVLLIVVILGGGPPQTIFALGVAGTPLFFRLSRGYARSILASEFIAAATALGASWRTLIRKHVVPNLLSPLLVQASSVAAVFLLVEASLSYLGLGVAPPTPTWGNVLQDARAYLLRQPWAAVGPGLVLGATAFSLQLLSDGLRDHLDPRSR